MASYRFLNLNTYKGKYLDKIIHFVKQQQFDLVHLQEVSGGEISQNPAGDDFGTVSQQLWLQGKLASAMGLKKDPKAYFGNATFFNQKRLKLLDTKILRLSPYLELADYDHRRIEDDSRCVLILKFEAGNHRLVALNTHLAWGPRPDDKPYKLKQARVLIDYLKRLKQPFILSGDFNLTPDTQIVQAFDEIARNISLEYGATNTLNPHLHRAKSLFPPGLFVDFVYASREIQVKAFEVKPADLSDHYPSILEFSWKA